MEGLETVREVELVPVGAAQEFEARQTFSGRRLESIQQGDDARRELAVVRVESDPVQKHALLERDVVDKRDCPAVERERDDARGIDGRKRPKRSAVEKLSGRRREAGAVRASLPAELVEP